METSEALRIAHEKNLDLIEIVPSVRPPVCKIMDYGKFKYEREKAERERGKKQKDIDIKGIRIGFTTGKHDLELRTRQVEKFLADGDRVRIQMKLVGREKAHRDLAMQKFNEFLSMIPTDHKFDQPPKRLPQGIMAVISKR